MRASGGGAATGGGISFQAVVTAVAGVYMMRGAPIGWHAGDLVGTPVAVWAETNDPGDDLRLELADGGIVEVQAKKGLSRGSDLWSSLLSLARAVDDGRISFGLLAVAPDSSHTVRQDLSQDIRRLGDGRDDALTEIGRDFQARLKSAGLSVPDVCKRIGIQVVHGLSSDDSDIRAAIEVLRHICALETQAETAWNTLYQDANAIITRRGRWQLPQLVKLLEATGIRIRDAQFSAGIVSKLTNWVAESNALFTLAGLRKHLPLSALLPLKMVAFSFSEPRAEDATAALGHEPINRIPESGWS